MYMYTVEILLFNRSFNYDTSSNFCYNKDFSQTNIFISVEQFSKMYVEDFTYR